MCCVVYTHICVITVGDIGSMKKCLTNIHIVLGAIPSTSMNKLTN